MNRELLHDYQLRAIQFIKEHPFAGCFLDMGLGKSVITLTAISDMMNNLEVSKTLIVAPKKVAETTWTDECDKWEHLCDLRVARVMGDEQKRIQALNRDADIYVIGRDSFVWLAMYYKFKLPFDTLVIDELTSFKSPSSQRFKAMRKVRPHFTHIIGLTGTPAPNGYLDLWSQVFCLDGGERLGKFVTHYKRTYFKEVKSSQGWTMKCSLLKGAKEAIEKKIGDICIAMKGEDYLSLPDMNIIPFRVQLPSPIMKRYNQFESDMVLSVSKSELIIASSAAALMNKLSQYANGCVYTEDHLPREIHDEKLEALTEIVEQAKSPVLCFYQYKHDVARITRNIPDARVYEGEQDLRDWNEGKIPLLLAHPASTAYGLNMQRGGHNIVWFGMGWNLELFQQANARLYRQGQQYPVNVYLLLCEGTVDNLAYKAILRKEGEQDMLMDSIKSLMDKYYENRKVFYTGRDVLQ